MYSNHLPHESIWMFPHPPRSYTVVWCLRADRSTIRVIRASEFYLMTGRTCRVAVWVKIYHFGFAKRKLCSAEYKKKLMIKSGKLPLTPQETTDNLFNFMVRREIKRKAICRMAAKIAIVWLWISELLFFIMFSVTKWKRLTKHKIVQKQNHHWYWYTKWKFHYYPLYVYVVLLLLAFYVVAANV
jgi:hypothetical protein